MAVIMFRCSYLLNLQLNRTCNNIPILKKEKQMV